MSEINAWYAMDEVASKAGVSYGTLLVLLRKHGDRIPSEREGRRRLFPSRAIEVVREIVREKKARRDRTTRRNPREQAASDKAANMIAIAMRRLNEAAADLTSALHLLRNSPGSVVVHIQTLHPNTFRTRRPLDVLVEFDGPGFVAQLMEVPLSAKGDTRQEAVMNLRALMVRAYCDLLEVERKQWTEELRAKSALLDLVKEIPSREAGGRS
ncbi:MAG TPA: hypothetical protein VIE43_16525 [Thermoanaerobaculia bacterium]|jgi:hypothetical protein|nr:hypothetical protein [Thermoanaerobaculia bacterium]